MSKENVYIRLYELRYIDLVWWQNDEVTINNCYD